ncbi:vacuolar protein sorting-associated protein 53 homolog [Paramacrobiotus metropolitanus]|uniref:vacuolar protein sorting-associated protein 53 homolog n=1 Tax=Paramacrobiotus metropolitanus TaxID=2943436 RepID=UPI00244573EE|nr:vacuolar protein sorting-associated protein 53 homolog [Paramacrobiotus metropolitanus]
MAGLGGNGDDTVAEPELDNHLDLPPEILKAIQEIFPSDDPLDRPDFSVVDYINALFPTEQSLSSIDDVIYKIRQEMVALDREIRGTLRMQTEAGDEGQQALKEAQNAIAQLFVQIKDIKQKAEKSEEMVKEITGDIKQLDHAKRHLTASITTLNHLHMLVSGVDSLEALQSRRQYGEIANLLQGLMNVLEHFEKYLAIPEIKQLADRLTKVRQELGVQLLSDFREAFSGTHAKHATASHQLADACRVVSVLDPKIRKELLRWFIKMQLSEYTVLFQESQDAAWLDKVDRRYNWLKMFLADFEKRFGAMFPVDWEMSERLTVEFCDITRSELSKVMASRKQEIDVNLLIFAIEKTVEFETFLGKRFPGFTGAVDDEDVPMILQGAARIKQQKPVEYPTDKNPFEQIQQSDTSLKSEVKVTSLPPKSALAPFQGIISRCFESFMDIYIDSKDRNLGEIMDKLVEDFRSKGVPKPTDAALHEGGLGIVLPSCADLFIFYKKSMLQCTQLTYGGHALVQLANVFRKHLKSYGQRMLLNNLPKSQTGVASISAATTGLIQSFLKEGDMLIARLTEDELRKICSILTTAEYCCETIQQLEDKLKEKVGPELASEIDFSPEQENFNIIITNSIQLLVNDLEAACEPALVAMIKKQWQSVEVVGDQSGFVTAVVSHLRTTLPVLRSYLSSSRKYFTQFCIKFANTFIPKYIAHVYKCKPISAVGAEQLLLDTHMLKTVLLDLPSLGSQISRKPPSSFTKIVTKGMTKAEMILKVIMTPHDSPKAFIEKYVQLMPESDTNELGKILEMKGVKRGDQPIFSELYRNQAPSSSQQIHGDGVPHSVTEPESGRIKKLEMLLKKKLTDY